MSTGTPNWMLFSSVRMYVASVSLHTVSLLSFSMFLIHLLACNAQHNSEMQHHRVPRSAHIMVSSNRRDCRHRHCHNHAGSSADNHHRSVSTARTWPWGSIMSGHRRAREMMVPLSIDSVSLGSPSICHCRIATGSPTVSLRLNPRVPAPPQQCNTWLCQHTEWWDCSCTVKWFVHVLV